MDGGCNHVGRELIAEHTCRWEEIGLVPHNGKGSLGTLSLGLLYIAEGHKPWRGDETTHRNDYEYFGIWEQQDLLVTILRHRNFHFLTMQVYF